MNLTSNGIARQLSPDSLQRLHDICEQVELHAGQVLEPADGADPPVYFLVHAAVGLWMEPSPATPRIALSVVGAEGMAGCSHLWQYPHPQWIGRVLKSGQAWQTPASRLQALLPELPDLSLALSRFLWAQTMEIAQLSARMQLGDIRTRLALWLHLLQYKTGSAVLHITHQTLAEMTGIRRVSITLALGELQIEGVLALRRGAIEVLNRAALERAAGLHMPSPKHTGSD